MTGKENVSLPHGAQTESQKWDSGRSCVLKIQTASINIKKTCYKGPKLYHFSAFYMFSKSLEFTAFSIFKPLLTSYSENFASAAEVKIGLSQVDYVLVKPVMP